jgi:hypothetical protein
METPRKEFIDVQTVEAQLSDSDSSAGNKNSGNNKMPRFSY